MKELGEDSAFYVIAYISSIAFVQTPLAQELWTSLYTNYSNQFIGKFLTLTQSLGLYWMLSLAFMVIDLKGWLQQFKIQKNVQVSIKDYKKCIPTVLKNQCFITIPLAILSNSDRLYILPTLPSASTMIWNLTFFYFCKALAFYYIHRLVHHPKLYKKVHKKHHEYIAPIAMATIYSTATEHLIANTIPTVVGPIILGLFGRTHMVTVWLFYNILTINTAINHCGYDFWGFPSSLFHDFHHLKFNVNYGSFGYIDWILGTDKGFKEYEENFKSRADKLNVHVKEE